MRYLFILLLCALLSGCWFIWIPLRSFSGNTCVAERAYVGQRLQNTETGKWGTVQKIYGRSERCQEGTNPMLADVEYGD